MMTYYKLTDRGGYTRRGLSGKTHWSVGATIYPTGRGSSACGPGVIHLYRHPLEAVLFNPIHANYANARLWRVQTDAPVQTDGLKYWTQGPVLVVEELDRPEPLPPSQCAAWAILVARTMPQLPVWITWADRWLDRTDRTMASAAVAEAAATDGEAAEATRAAWGAWAAAAEVTWAVDASDAAEAAARAAWAAAAARTWAADAAAEATRAAWAAWAAAEAAAHTGSLDWVALWEQAAQYAEDQR